VVCDGFKGIKEEDLERLFKLLDDWVQLEPEILYLKN